MTMVGWFWGCFKEWSVVPAGLVLQGWKGHHQSGLGKFDAEEAELS